MPLGAIDTATRHHIYGLASYASELGAMNVADVAARGSTALRGLQVPKRGASHCKPSHGCDHLRAHMTFFCRTLHRSLQICKSRDQSAGSFFLISRCPALRKS